MKHISRVLIAEFTGDASLANFLQFSFQRMNRFERSALQQDALKGHIFYLKQNVSEIRSISNSMVFSLSTDTFYKVNVPLYE